MNNKETKAVVNNSCKIARGFKRREINFGSFSFSWEEAQNHLSAWLEDNGGCWDDTAHYLSSEINHLPYEEIEGFQDYKFYVPFAGESKYARETALDCAAYVVAKLIQPKLVKA